MFSTVLWKVIKQMICSFDKQNYIYGKNCLTLSEIFSNEKIQVTLWTFNCIAWQSAFQCSYDNKNIFSLFWSFLLSLNSTWEDLNTPLDNMLTFAMSSVWPQTLRTSTHPVWDVRIYSSANVAASESFYLLLIYVCNNIHRKCVLYTVFVIKSRNWSRFSIPDAVNQLPHTQTLDTTAHLFLPYLKHCRNAFGTICYALRMAALTFEYL